MLKGHLKCKAAEARFALPLVIHLLQRPRIAAALGAQKANKLLKAALPLQRMYTIMQEGAGTRRIDDREFGKAALRCLRASRIAKIPLIPKFHLLVHWGQVARRLGNPDGYNTCRDETHNASIVRVIQSSCDANHISEVVLIRARLQRLTLRGDL